MSRGKDLKPRKRDGYRRAALARWDRRGRGTDPMKADSRWKRYRITPPQVQEMFTKQEGRCVICEKELSLEKKHGFTVDHNHQTGEVRGLLCVPCNASLGWHEKWASKADAYLSRNYALDTDRHSCSSKPCT